MGVNLFSVALPRGIALFLGAFGLANLIGESISPGFDANLWWIDLPSCSTAMERTLLGWSSVCFLWFVFSQRLTTTAKVIQTITVSALFEVSVWNAATFSHLIATQEIHSRSWISFSACVTGALVLVICGIWSTRSGRDVISREIQFGKLWRVFTVVGMATCCAAVFSLAQMYCFGSTDYRRPGDIAVILGSRVYADGTVSLALDDRLQTGCELYHQGLVPRLLMSGGPADGEHHETDAMRARAMELGVPSEAIFIDREGLNTQATAINTVQLCRDNHWHRVLAVSQFYHLPRVKLAFHRHQLEVFTVPAVETRSLPKLPFYLLREIAALWMYYFWF
jgi:vancomycin permeability regulator SanA